jgi:hypothetical protein
MATRTHPFNTIGQFVLWHNEEIRKARRSLLLWTWVPRLFCLSVAIWGVSAIVLHHREVAAKAPATSSQFCDTVQGVTVCFADGKATTSYGHDQPVGIITQGPVWLAMMAAKTKWEAALHRAIKTPRLEIGDCNNSRDALACAVKETWTIEVARTGKGLDEQLIMLHEIGHLLGVPHIEDDPLMGFSYREGVPIEISPAALALARLTFKP